MNPLNFRLKPYDQIDELLPHQVTELRNTYKIVIFHNLVVNYTGFDHPGYNNIIDSYQGRQITKSYLNQHHSFNADLIICHRTIGRIRNSTSEVDGKPFYEDIKNCDKNVKHQASLQKMNFNNPIMVQLQKLNAEQLTIMSQIPKIFEQPQKIRFRETWLQNLIYNNNFWFTLSVFLLQTLLITYWIFTHYTLEEIKRNSGFFIIGAMKWTAVEYIFHRFILHQTVLNAKQMQGHLIHHAFPKMKEKVAIYPFRTSIQFILIGIGYSYFIDSLAICLIFIGLYSTIMLYESLHYYCHFGPQINIKWIKYMRIYHLKHHYRNQDRYFGVTNPFWDQIFGTGIDPKLKK